jgi:hypothetical protein
MVVRPRLACLMLDIGVTRLYELIETGELESFKDGGARKITVRSIKARIERLVGRAEDKTNPPAPNPTGPGKGNKGFQRRGSAASPPAAG